MNIPQLVASQTIELYGNVAYEQKFLGMGVMPGGYRPDAHAIINAKYIQVDISGHDNPAQAITLMTNELAKTGLHIDSVQTSVSPWAIELDESTLGASVMNSALIASIVNRLRIQSDLLHKERLLDVKNGMVSKLDPWSLDVPALTMKLLSIFDEQSIHFSRQSRKILYLPEVIASQLLGARLASDMTKSELDIIRDICQENNVAIVQYPTLSQGIVDVILIQHDALATFPGIEPFHKLTYESPNQLVRSYQFLFSVAGFAPNAGSAEANRHIITHLPVDLELEVIPNPLRLDLEPNLSSVDAKAKAKESATK